MLSGHFAPALLAHEKQLPKGALLYFLISSQIQDLLWLVFHYLVWYSGIYNSYKHNHTSTHAHVRGIGFLSQSLCIKNNLFETIKLGKNKIE